MEEEEEEEQNEPRCKNENSKQLLLPSLAAVCLPHYGPPFPFFMPLLLISPADVR